MSNKKSAAPAEPKTDAVESPAVPAPSATVIENAEFSIVDNTEAPEVVEKAAEEAELDLGSGVTQVNYV